MLFINDKKLIKNICKYFEGFNNHMKNIDSKSNTYIVNGNEIKIIEKEIFPQYNILEFTEECFDDSNDLFKNNFPAFVVNKEELKNFGIAKQSVQIKKVERNEQDKIIEVKTKLDVSVNEIKIEDGFLIFSRENEYDDLPKELKFKILEEVDDNFLENEFNILESQMEFIAEYELETDMFEKMDQDSNQPIYIVIDDENEDAYLSDNLDNVEKKNGLYKFIINNKYIFGQEFKKFKDLPNRSLMSIPFIKVYKKNEIILFELIFKSIYYTVKQKYITVDF